MILLIVLAQFCGDDVGADRSLCGVDGHQNQDP